MVQRSGTANNTYLQPFISYVTKDAWTFTVDTESTFNWDARRASNPMNAIVSKLVYFGKMPVSLAVGARYYLTSRAARARPSVRAGLVHRDPAVLLQRQRGRDGNVANRAHDDAVCV